MAQEFKNIVYLSDTSGTGIWRRIFQADMMNSLGRDLNLNVTTTMQPILDKNYYQGMTSITCQRWISDQQVNLFCNYFKPLMDGVCGWLIYEIDDNMSDKCIPKFNKGRKAFEGERIQNNIKQMLNAADFVTVTTDYIKKFYHEHYGVKLENIIAVPNLLPKWWFGDKYDPKKKVEQFKKYKSKPRIGIVSSLSHFNVDDVYEDDEGLVCRRRKNIKNEEEWVNEHGQVVDKSKIRHIDDDLDDLIDMIRSTVKDFQWVMFGYCHPKLQDLANKKLIEVQSSVMLLDYAFKFNSLQLQAVVAPIQKTEFNFCKSFIKTMECAALGIPLYATNCLPYDRVMDKSQLFDTPEELKEKLTYLKFATPSIYENIITKQWKWLNSPHEEGDFKINNFWLEDNIETVWLKIFKLRQKGLNLSYSNFVTQMESKTAEENSHLLYKSESGKARILA